MHLKINISIRILNHDDVDIFRTFRIQAVHESPSSFTQSIAEIAEKSHADFADCLQSHSKGDFVLGAFDDTNQLVGVVGWYRAIHAKESHKGTLWGMYVSPEKRRDGIGDLLVASAIKHVRKLPGILSIILRVTASNEAAKRLYESNGFQVCGVERKAIHVDEGYVDETLMQLVL